MNSLFCSTPLCVLLWTGCDTTKGKRVGVENVHHQYKEERMSSKWASANHSQQNRHELFSLLFRTSRHGYPALDRNKTVKKLTSLFYTKAPQIEEHCCELVLLWTGDPQAIFCTDGSKKQAQLYDGCSEFAIFVQKNERGFYKTKPATKYIYE